MRRETQQRETRRGNSRRGPKRHERRGRPGLERRRARSGNRRGPKRHERRGRPGLERRRTRSGDRRGRPGRRSHAPRGPRNVERRRTRERARGRTRERGRQGRPGFERGRRGMEDVSRAVQLTDSGFELRITTENEERVPVVQAHAEMRHEMSKGKPHLAKLAARGGRLTPTAARLYLQRANIETSVQHTENGTKIVHTGSTDDAKAALRSLGASIQSRMNPEAEEASEAE